MLGVRGATTPVGLGAPGDGESAGAPDAGAAGAAVDAEGPVLRPEGLPFAPRIHQCLRL